jgi:hypothetical protein
VVRFGSRDPSKCQWWNCILSDSVISALSRMQKMCDTSGHRGGICACVKEVQNKLFAFRVLEFGETQGEDSNGGLEERGTW